MYEQRMHITFIKEFKVLQITFVQNELNRSAE